MAHVLITGGGTGIGLAIARAFAAQGQSVTLLGRKANVLAAAVTSLQEDYPQAPCAYQTADICDEAAVRVAFAAASAAFGDVTVLVNNAGQATPAPFMKTDLANWQRMLNVNLTGTFICTQSVLPAMLARDKKDHSPLRIINVASTAGLVGYAYVTAYTAAKHGVIGLTKALALELAKTNITVNAVCPGYTETAIVADAVANIVAKTGRTEAQAMEELSKTNPQKRLVQPHEVANAVLWLASAGASSITGQSIAVAGGEVMK